MTYQNLDQKIYKRLQGVAAELHAQPSRNGEPRVKTGAP